MQARTRNDGSAAAEVPPTDAARIDIGDIYDIVIARRRLLIPALAFSFAIAFGYILLAPVRYTASLSILVDPRERVPVGLDLQPMPSTPDPALVESRMRELTSRAVLRRVVDSENLLTDPASKPGVFGLALETVGDLLRGRPLTSEERMDRAVESLAKEISTKRSERSYVVDVDVKAKTPDKAVHLGQSLVAAYFANQSALSDELIKKQTAWLDGRVDDVRTRVETAERRVQDYRDKEGIAETDGRSSPEQQLNQANAALVAAQGRRAEVEARYAELKSAIAHGVSPESVNEVIHSPTIEKLRQDYAVAAREEADLRTALGPRHPSYIAAQARVVSMRAQVTDEFKRIALATEREMQAARAAEQSASALVTKLTASTNAMGDRRIGLTDLEHEAATLRATYEKFVAARENVRRDIVESPLSVLVDPPVAGTSRTSPKALPALLIALVAAINIWIAAALIMNFRERRRPTAAPATEAKVSATPPEPDWVIARLPPLDPSRPVAERERGGPPRSAAERIGDAMSLDGAFAVAVNGVLAKLHDHFGDSDAPSRLAIAPIRPGAGASTLALALAHAACDEGLRVLLADCHGAKSPLTERSGRDSARRRSTGEIRINQTSGGQISFMPYSEGRHAEDDRRDGKGFDLVLLDCGSLSAAGYVINRLKAADAALAVDIGDATRENPAAAIKAAGLEQSLVGIVLTPIRLEAWRKAS